MDNQKSPIKRRTWPKRRGDSTNGSLNLRNDFWVTEAQTIEPGVWVSCGRPRGRQSCTQDTFHWRYERR